MEEDTRRYIRFVWLCHHIIQHRHLHAQVTKSAKVSAGENWVPGFAVAIHEHFRLFHGRKELRTVLRPSHRPCVLALLGQLLALN